MAEMNRSTSTGLRRRDYWTRLNSFWLIFLLSQYTVLHNQTWKLSRRTVGAHLTEWAHRKQHCQWICKEAGLDSPRNTVIHHPNPVQKANALTGFNWVYPCRWRILLCPGKLPRNDEISSYTPLSLCRESIGLSALNWGLPWDARIISLISREFTHYVSIGWNLLQADHLNEASRSSEWTA